MNDVLLPLLAVALAAVALLAVRGAARTRASERAQAETAARLRDGLTRMEREASWSREILERMAEGVLVLDEELRPILSNQSTRDLLGLQPDSMPGRLPSEEIVSVARAALDRAHSGEPQREDALPDEDRHGEGRQEIVSIWFPARMNLWVRASPLQDGSGVVVVLQDVTEELKIQRVRREFVAHASHELKSPVTALQTLAEVLQRAVHEDPETAVRFAERLVAEADRLGRLTEDLLDLSRLEEAESLPDESVNLSEVAHRESERIEPSVTGSGSTFQENISPGVWVRGDDRQLALMLRNLLQNAARYTPAGGKVWIDVLEQEENAVVRVGDTGIGIPLEAQGRVFERFYRVDRARSRDQGGTGLGLAIVKHVVELHHGQISVESELGQGSVFTARLPGGVPHKAVQSMAG
jgi:signal transduction histidine kinase